MSYNPLNPLFQSQSNPAMGFYGNPNLSMTGGGAGWGIDPSLMTPSYMAPYRPHMQGANAYTAYSRPSWAGGVSQLVNPFFKDPYWGNPVHNNQAAIDSVATRPMDAAASFGQRWVVPAIAMGAASRMLGPNTGSLGGDMLGLITGKGIAGSIGRGVGASVGGALEWATAIPKLGAFGGAVGGALGTIALPILAGQAMASVANNTVFQPYLNTRRTSRELQDSFQGVTFGAGSGNPITGRGLGGYESSKIASQINSFGMKDMTFSSGEYSSLASMSMRSGLMDNIGSGQIAGRVKSIADQVKMILSISKDPSVQSAIEELSKLRLAGASVGGGTGSIAMGAYRNIGLSASIAGASMQHVMNTAGAQGGMMYQMNGMTPYLGMMAAANVYGGFANAQRLGIIGDSHMARMGGLAGAMQSSLGGQISAMMTPFAQMAGMNQYMFGSGGTSVMGGGMNVTGVVSAFGRGVSNNPIQAQGSMALYGPMMASKMISQHGGRGTEDLATSLLRSTGQNGLGAGGKFTAEQTAVALQNLGMSPDQVQAFLSQRAADTGPGALAGKLRALNASDKEDAMQYVSQNTLQNTILGNATYSVKRSLYATGDSVANSLGRMPASVAGALQDSVASSWDRLFYGGTVSNSGRPSPETLTGAGFSVTGNDKYNVYTSSSKGISADAAVSNVEKSRHLLFNSKLADTFFNGKSYENSSVTDQDIRGISGVINEVLKNPEHKNYQDAVALSKSGISSPEGRAAFSRLLNGAGGKYAELLSKEGAFDKLSTAFSSSAWTGSISVVGAKTSDLSSITGLKDAAASDNWKVMGQAMELMGHVGDIHGDTADMFALSGELGSGRYRELAEALGKDASDPASALKRIKGILKGTLSEGYTRQAKIAASFGSTDQMVDSMPADMRRSYAKADAAGKKRIIDGYIKQLSGGSDAYTGIALSEDKSLEDIVGGIRSLQGSGEAAKAAAEQATTGLDLSSFTAISKSMESSANINEVAAQMQLRAAILNAGSAGSNQKTQDGRGR